MPSPEKQREHLNRARTMRTGERKKPGLGEPIRADSLYTLEQLEEFAGIGAWSFRKMEREGLPTVKIGSRKFVIGADLIEFVKRYRSVDPPQMSEARRRENERIQRELEADGF